MRIHAYDTLDAGKKFHEPIHDFRRITPAKPTKIPGVPPLCQEV